MSIQKTNPAPRKRRWLWPVLIIAALIAAGAWWHHHRSVAAEGGDAAQGQGGGKRGGNANRIQPVSATAAQQRDVRVTVSAIGTIAAANTAVVRARVDGELKVIHFSEGQLVKAGALLAEIDSRPFQIALDQAQGQLERDQALLQNARLDLQRYQDLITKDAAPKQQADTQASLVKQLQGTVQADQAAVANARLQLSYTRVTAPISGMAGLKQADLGNIIHASDANGLLSIAQMVPASLVFAVPEAHLPRIRQQLAAGKALKVEAWDRDQRILLAEGKVASTDNAIDTTTGTIKVKALFPNTDGGLFPNQFVNVKLQLDTLASTLAVPSAAVQRGAPGTYVYVVDADSKASLRKVTVGATDGDWTAVQGEIKPGEQVVTDGADKLRDGGKVEVIVPGKNDGAGGGGRHHGKGAKDGAGGSAAAPANGAASAPVQAGSGPAGQTGSGPAAGGSERWMSRVPPEMVEKLKAMSPEDRRAWLQQHRGEQAGKAENQPAS